MIIRQNDTLEVTPPYIVPLLSLRSKSFFKELTPIDKGGKNQMTELFPLEVYLFTISLYKSP